MKKWRYLIVFIFSYLQVIMAGTVVFQTFVMYPNIFSNPPASLELSMQFFQRVAPGDFFPPFGAALLGTGLVSLLITFRYKKVFYYLLASVLLLFIGDGILSIFYFWPRNTVLFIEGLSIHSAETLHRVAIEFERAHYFRLLTSTAASICAVIGLTHGAVLTYKSSQTALLPFTSKFK
jgi:uncharacterized membrane protein